MIESLAPYIEESLSHTKNIKHSSESVEWFTPIDIIEKSRQVLGCIHLDPASSLEANKAVRADNFYTKDEDGLSAYWYGNIFLNPPGGKLNNKSVAKLFWNKLVSSQINHAIFVAFSMETLQVAQKGVKHSIGRYTVCIPNQRLKYRLGGSNEAKSPPHASAIIYVPGLVNRDYLFAETFRSLGTIYKPY